MGIRCVRMASMIVIAVYVVVGAGAAVSMIHREPKRSVRPLLMLLLWPFLLPAALFREAPIRHHRLEALAEEIRSALVRCGSDEQHRNVDAFVTQTLAEQSALAE